MLILDLTQHAQPSWTADTYLVLEPAAGLNSLMFLQTHQ